MGKIVALLLGILLTFSAASWGHNKPCEKILNSRHAQSWDGQILILDTNVIFNDPNVIHRYPGATLVIPETVLKEIDKKKEDEKLGRAARQFSRSIVRLIKTGDDVSGGIRIKNGAILKVDSQDYGWVLAGKTYDLNENDNKILATAIYYAMEAKTSAGSGKTQVTLISDDINMRIKAASENLNASALDYEIPKNQHIEKNKWSNFVKHNVSETQLETFKREGFLPKPQDLDIVPNQFVMFTTETNEGSLETLARYHYNSEELSASGLRMLADFSHLPIQPKNIEQAMLLDVLLDPNIQMVISQSPAGTGKTFLALLAGLLQLGADPKLFDQVMVTRALVRIGREDLGAVPGDLKQKLGHWNESVDDAFLALSKSNRGTNPDSTLTAEEKELLTTPRKDLTPSQRRERQKLREAAQKSEKGNFKVSRNKVNLVAFPHLRGRSISDAFLILDEAQNTSSHEMKTVLTRAGEGTKMIILGDASQIDSPYLNEQNNGLSVISQLVLDDRDTAGRSLVAYIELTDGVRSALAEYCRLLFEKLEKH